MGYECPVCETPQADQRHLADHLAMTAATRGGDHERWLDEHVPDWGAMGPDELGPILAERASEREFPQVFEDTTGHDQRLEDHLASGRRGRGELTDEARSALQEAREMTERMIEESDGDEDE